MTLQKLQNYEEHRYNRYKLFFPEQWNPELEDTYLRGEGKYLKEIWGGKILIHRAW